MTKSTTKHFEHRIHMRIPEMVERVVQRATRLAESASRDTEHLERRIQRAAEKARKQAERAESRAIKIEKRIRHKAEKGRPPNVKDELRTVALQIEQQALATVESALHEFEKHLEEIDAQAIVQRVESELAKIDIDGITQELESAIHEASQDVKVVMAGHDLETEDQQPSTPKQAKPDSVSDEERLTVLRMVQNGSITAEEAEQLLNSLEGSAG